MILLIIKAKKKDTIEIQNNITIYECEEKKYKTVSTGIIEEDTEKIFADYKTSDNCKVYIVIIPKKVYEHRVTNEFKLILDEEWTKEHNGDMLMITIDEIDSYYSFEIAKEVNELILNMYEDNKQEESQDSQGSDW